MNAVPRKLDARGMSYVKDRLRLGKDLSERVLQLVNLDAGDLTVLAPQSAPDSALYALGAGGIAAWDGVGAQADELLMHAIDEHLHRGVDSIVAIEDETRQLGDRALKTFPGTPVTYGRNVYHLLRAGSEPAQIRSTLKLSTSAWLNVVFFSRWHFAGPTEMSEADVIGIARATQKLAISAYDGESWILWERAGSRRDR